MTTKAELLALRFTRGELEIQLDAAAKELLGGKTVTSWSVGDSSAEKQVWLNSPPEVRMDIIGQALCILAPEFYTPDKVIGITQTRPTFG